MEFDTKYTNTVYVSHFHEVRVDDSGSRSVVATRAIPQSSLIVVEQTFSSSNKGMVVGVTTCEKLRGHLCPRDEDANILAKCERNLFKAGVVENREYIIGAMISAFNHCSTPNAAILHYGQPIAFTDVETPDIITFAVVWSVCDISMGEEITISYGNKVSAVHPFIKPTDADPFVEMPVFIRELSERMIMCVCTGNTEKTNKVLDAYEAAHTL